MPAAWRFSTGKSLSGRRADAGHRGARLRMGRCRIHPDSERHQPGAWKATDYRMSVHVIRDAPGRLRTRRAASSIRALPTAIIFSGILADDPRIDLLVDKWLSLRLARPLPQADLDLCPRRYRQRMGSLCCNRAADRRRPSPHRARSIHGAPPLLRAWTGSTVLPAHSAKPALETPTDLIAEGDLSTRFGRAERARAAAASRSRRRPSSASTNPRRSASCRGSAASGGRSAPTSTSSPMTTSTSAPISPRRSRTFYQPIEVLGSTLGQFLLQRMAGGGPAGAAAGLQANADRKAARQSRRRLA